MVLDAVDINIFNENAYTMNFIVQQSNPCDKRKYKFISRLSWGRRASTLYSQFVSRKFLRGSQRFQSSDTEDDEFESSSSDDGIVLKMRF